MSEKKNFDPSDLVIRGVQPSAYRGGLAQITGYKSCRTTNVDNLWDAEMSFTYAVFTIHVPEMV